MPDTTQAVEPTVAGQAPTTATPTVTTAPGAQDGGKDKEQPQTGAVAKVEDLPDWAQKEIKDLRTEAAARRKAATEAETAAKAADEANLAQNAKWQELATKRGGELDALKPKAELADKLTEMVTAQYTAEIATWPEQVKAMAPDAEADILTKLAWMNKAKPLAVELMADKTPTPGNGTRPKPAAPAGVAKATEETRSAWSKQATQRYR